MGHWAKQKYERMPLALNVIKKVLCSAEKSSVIWAEAHSRSSAKLNVRSVTKTVKVGYKMARKGKKENEPKYTNVNTAYCIKVLNNAWRPLPLLVSWWILVTTSSTVVTWVARHHRFPMIFSSEFTEIAHFYHTFLHSPVCGSNTFLSFTFSIKGFLYIVFHVVIVYICELKYVEINVKSFSKLVQ